MSKQIGIVGRGVGKENCRGFLPDKRARIVALCDIIPEKMDAFAKELPSPVKKYVDYHDMARDAEVDAMVVCPPNQWRALGRRTRRRSFSWSFSAPRRGRRWTR